MNNIYNFEKVREEHIPLLVELEKEIFSPPYTKKMLEHDMKSEYSHFYVTTFENNIVGYFDFYLVLDEGHIVNFAVIPAFRKRGLANIMMKRIFQIGEENGVKYYFLEVRKSNEQAIILYKKHGFVEAGIRRRYYSDPLEDALLMTKFV